MCGEHASTDGGLLFGDGSPPRARGSTRGRRTSRCRRADHPRVCGEHSFLTATQPELIGSPPRVRGSTHRACPRGFPRSDHPRMCREHTASCTDSFADNGSAPRVRGARQEKAEDERLVRITPACAGSTCLCPGCGSTPQDHPRVCGEHPVETVVVSKVSGSPRVCGEHDTSVFGMPTMIGSPPRVRGARLRHQRLLWPVRVTPARAGSTPTRSPSSSITWDHPRMYGEHVLAIAPTA